MGWSGFLPRVLLELDGRERAVAHPDLRLGRLHPLEGLLANPLRGAGPLHRHGPIGWRRMELRDRRRPIARAGRHADRRAAQRNGRPDLQAKPMRAFRCNSTNGTRRSRPRKTPSPRGIANRRAAANLEKRSAEHERTAAALAENRLAVAAADERRSQWDRQRTVLDRERPTPNGGTTPPPRA